MNDGTKKLTVIAAGIVALSFAFVLYQGMVVQPRTAMELAERVRMEGIDYANAQKLRLSLCLDAADTAYWAWIKLNMTEQDDGSYQGPTYNWDKAAANKKTAEDACYRQFSK